jgi:hypothetical protein
MPKRLRDLVSPSMAVALLALFVALTGTGYAALKVNGKDIRKRSIPGNRLVNDSVTGRQVNEARLGAVPRAQSADTLAGLGPDSFLRDPSVFLAAGAKAADSDMLDGIDSAGFVKGGGNVNGQTLDAGPNTTNFLGPAIGGLVRFRYQCPFSLASNGAFRIINSSTAAANLFVDTGGASPDYFQLGAGGFVDYPAAAGGDSFFVQMQGDPGVVLASAATVNRSASSDCHAQVLGVLGQ